MLTASKGAVHWSISSLTRNTMLAQGLLDGPYKKEALVPASPWLGNEAPDAPTVTQEKHGREVEVSWSHADPDDVFKWVVYYRYGDQWDYTILPSDARMLKLATHTDGETGLADVRVTAVDRLGNESERSGISGQ